MVSALSCFDLLDSKQKYLVVCEVTCRRSADRQTEVLRVTARGLCCVRGTVLRLCVVWVCGLQLRRRTGAR